MVKAKSPKTPLDYLKYLKIQSKMAPLNHQPQFTKK